jgi:protein SCO1/2
MNGLKAVRIAVWALVAVLAVGVTYVVVARQLGDAASPLVASDIGGPFTLVDQTGATVTEAALKGHPSLMFFGYTFCPDVCPTTLYEASGWLKELGDDGKDLRVFFVTVDPERDTQEQMATYLEAFDPRITGLTGPRPAIDAMIRDFRIYTNKVPREDGRYLMDHTAAVLLLDRDGRFVGTIDYEEKPEIALAKLKRLVGAS